MSPEGWDELPWYEKRLLLDGLQEENVIGKSDSAGPPVAAGAPKGNGTVAAMSRRNVAADFSKFTQQLEAMRKPVLDGL